MEHGYHQSGRGLHLHVRDRSQIGQYPIHCRNEVTPEKIRPPENRRREEKILPALSLLATNVMDLAGLGSLPRSG